MTCRVPWRLLRPVPCPNPLNATTRHRATSCAGTGRSLSLKLISQLRDEGAKLASGKKAAEASGGGGGGGSLARTFREVQLQEPIR